MAGAGSLHVQCHNQTYNGTTGFNNMISFQVVVCLNLNLRYITKILTNGNPYRGVES
jgi:hypothetical protein